VTYPAPLPALVIRYSFLWSDEAKAGSNEGRKDRPCAIVVASPRMLTGDIRVAVVPVTHSRPEEKAAAVELPLEVTLSLGLDGEHAWLRPGELNVFAWPGDDLRPVPGTDRIAYGVLPRPLFERIRHGVLALNRARRVRQVGRD
jgi:hypothetical protein